MRWTSNAEQQQQQQQQQPHTDLDWNSCSSMSNNLDQTQSDSGVTDADVLNFLDEDPEFPDFSHLPPPPQQQQQQQWNPPPFALPAPAHVLWRPPPHLHTQQLPFAPVPDASAAFSQPFSHNEPLYAAQYTDYTTESLRASAPAQTSRIAPGTLKRARTEPDLTSAAPRARANKRRTAASARRARALVPSTPLAMRVRASSAPAESLDQVAPARRLSARAAAQSPHDDDEDDDDNDDDEDDDGSSGRGGARVRDSRYRNGKWDAHEKQLLLHLVYCFLDRELKEIARIGFGCGLQRSSRAIDKKLKRIVPFSRWRVRNVDAVRADLIRKLRENDWTQPSAEVRRALDEALAQAARANEPRNTPLYLL